VTSIIASGWKSQRGDKCTPGSSADDDGALERAHAEPLSDKARRKQHKSKIKAAEKQKKAGKAYMLC
jgi:hypothetical protein